MNVKEKLSRMSTYSQELSLDLKRPEHRFRWFLASILFAKRISAEVAKRTYKRFEEEQIVSPEDILNAGWDKIVEILDSGGYVRYDFSTATKLLEIARALKEKYGSLDELHRKARDSKDLERRLLEFKGIGPVTVNIFLRELRHVWKKANPKPSAIAIRVAKMLGLNESDTVAMESHLVRLNLEFCKKRKCNECPVKDFCQDKKL
ncbi:MAG: hypothetical protein H3Z49_07810 [archaeon]|nr:hypothetical protein [archaeon]